MAEFFEERVHIAPSALGTAGLDLLCGH
jgi:hypothetical protein